MIPEVWRHAALLFLGSLSGETDYILSKYHVFAVAI
jgi:hypothetical protein